MESFIFLCSVEKRLQSIRIWCFSVLMLVSNRFLAKVSFLYSRKTSENLCFFSIFLGGIERKH